jgi:hypothetical protein
MVEEEPEVLANVPSDVRLSLDPLYKVLCTKFDPFQVNEDDDTFSSLSLGWDEDHNEEYNTLWPTPLTTPLKEDDSTLHNLRSVDHTMDNVGPPTLKGPPITTSS